MATEPVPRGSRPATTAPISGRGPHIADYTSLNPREGVVDVEFDEERVGARDDVLDHDVVLRDPAGHGAGRMGEVAARFLRLSCDPGDRLPSGCRARGFA